MTNDLIITGNEKNLTALLGSDPRIKSDHTKRQYRSALAEFDGWRGGRELTKTLVEEYAALLQESGKAPATINQKLAAIRWLARKTADLAQDYHADNADAIEKQAARVASVEDVKGTRPMRGRHISPGELAALLRACEVDESTAGRRDAALIALAYATGLRRDELAGLSFSSLIPGDAQDELDVTVHGKGDKVRTAYVNDGAYAALADWLAVRGDADGALFCAINKGGGLNAGKHLSGEALRLILEKRGGQAQLSQPVTWHDFRRTFAGNLWAAGVDGASIQKLMGHASQDMTARYDRRPDEARRQAVKALHVPYHRRG